ncbi:MAG: transporter [Bacteroidetes bacterium]|jgi:ABC-type multidrug transport system ATPase subunit|nr:transporter [Bacteroidota bacterium]
MSEEILKALMQLFAIIAKQDGVLITDHEKFVRDFLSSQLSVERVSEYLKLYNEFLDGVKTEVSNGNTAEKSRTSMKDSVRTLAICKKINKTLAQKQKIIVLIRLIEFFKKDQHKSLNRTQIVEAVADVFNIEKTEFNEIKSFIFETENETSAGEIVIGDESLTGKLTCRQFLPFSHYHGLCKFIFIRSINIVVMKYHGHVELHLNGIVIKPETIYIFPQGSNLRLPQTTIYYSNIISKFIGSDNDESFSFEAHIENHTFPNGKQALHELKIAEMSGNLVGIMGASGSGKTTLLTLLSGQEKPTKGSIKINNSELGDKDDALKGFIGFVPQDDLLIEDLTVFQNLYYNAKLCFKDLSDEEVHYRINKTLLSLGLDEIRSIKVGNALNKKISGGQRKRLNIALELIREPQILFLDEPTSGLSSRDSENVMDLLKELTIKGKLIFVVIHQPSSDIFKMFDKMLILDTGGYATYYGNPIESVMYFKKVTNQINCEVGECYACGSVNPETIFNLLDLKEINEYGTYTDKRKISSIQFYQYYKDHFLMAFNFKGIQAKLQSTFKLPGKLVQTKYFFLRDVLAKLSNKQYVLINLLEVPVLVMFLSFIIRYTDTTKSETFTYFHNYNLPAYVFMSLIAALLVGLTLSAEEIFKDQKILKRERFLHLSRLSYLLSKVTLLFSISLIQSLLYVLIGHFILKIEFNYFNFFIMLLSVFCFANILGLILSASFNSPVTIYIIIPLIIIPQMLLGGAMFNFNKLNRYFGGGNKVPAAANFMISRWAYEGIVVDMQVNNKMARETFRLNKMESKLNYKLVYFIPKLQELVNKNKAEELSLVKNEIEKDYKEVSKIGFKAQLPLCKDTSGVLSYLGKLNGFYNAKFNTVSDMKQEQITRTIKKFGDKKIYEEYKQKYVNDKLDEVCTASLEKEKIVIEDGRLEQVIDPIYREPSGNKIFGAGTHFLSATKYLFGREISTFAFNLIVIWVINISLFAFLYFDVLKKIMNRFN